MAIRKSQPPLFHKMKGDFMVYICIHFYSQTVDKRACLCFNVTCIHHKDIEGKILPVQCSREPAFGASRCGGFGGLVPESVP